jgi:hypothetical protein
MNVSIASSVKFYAMCWFMAMTMKLTFILPHFLSQVVKTIGIPLAYFFCEHDLVVLRELGFGPNLQGKFAGTSWIGCFAGAN